MAKQKVITSGPTILLIDRTPQRQLVCLPSLESWDHPATLYPRFRQLLPPLGEPFEMWQVIMKEPHYEPEQVFLGTREECQEYIAEAYACTVGCMFLLQPTGRVIGGGQ